MKLNSDCYIQGTKLHPICEDYALTTDEEKYSLAIICDGCSTSIHTDVGARILAHTVKSEFTKLLDDDIMIWDSHLFQILDKAANFMKDLNIVREPRYYNIKPLFATLLYCLNFKNNLYVRFYGDGYLVVEFVDGEVMVYKAEYSMNAPYYPIYELSEPMKSNFKNQFGDQIFKITKNRIELNKPIFEDSFKISQYEPAVFTFNISDVKNISLLSDGVASFRKTGIQTNSITYNPIDIINKIIDWRSCSGPFVLRRCRRLINTELLNENYYNTDDFSIATIHIDHEKGE